ncbi:MAG: hypothetical protein HXX11_15730 [Desulfuromonadales bacterium]|nr:hypothetical protein [Desulfuromonadales bacterium]
MEFKRVRNLKYLFLVVVLSALSMLLLNACSGGSAWRYDPGIPKQVTGLRAESGFNLVSLKWNGSSVATSYNIYYVSAQTDTRVTKANGKKINVTFTSQVINGLDNDTTYYFMVTALNKDGESVESVQVSATPGPFSIASLLGTSLLVPSDIADAASLAAKLRNDPNPSTLPVSQWVWGLFDDSTKKILADPASTATQLQTALAQGLNKILQGSLIYNQTRFSDVTLRLESTALLAQKTAPTGENLVHLNRLLLEDVYLQLIVKQFGIWYFHTLVTGPDAKWERGTLTVDDEGNSVISGFEDSSGNTQPPPGFSITVSGTGEFSLSGAGTWAGFHGVIGSRKNMLTATFSPSLKSRAITIFQKKKADSEPDYTIADIMGAGSGQSAIDPTLLGNGPTRFAYHQLNSGSNTEWEYSNAKVGQHGNKWLEQYKDITYWDYASPSFHLLAGYDFFWKVSSFGIDKDGLVSEYWNFEQTGNFNTLKIHTPHQVVFSGRMTADKTVVVGVGTRSDTNGANPQYFLRIMELNFKPVDQTLPVYTMNDLAGDYKFHKIGSSTVSPFAAYGSMTISGTGVTTFPDYRDSNSGTNLSADSFTLSYLPDPGSDGKAYSDFANFASQPQSGTSHYYNGTIPNHVYYDFWSYPSVITDPSTWRPIPLSSSYYNEHGALSYNRDLFVLTRSEASASCLLIGLK